MSSKPLSAFQHAKQGSTDSYFSSDADWLIVSQNTKVQLWNMQEKALTYIWQQSSNESKPVYLTHISSGNGFAVTASQSEFSLWDMHSGKNIGYWQVKDSNIRDIAVTRSGSKILLGKSNGDILIFNPKTQEQHIFFGHSEKINQIALSADDIWALSASNDYTALLWDINSQKIIQRFVHPERITQIAISSNKRYLFVSSNRFASIYNSLTGKEICRLNAEHHQKSYSVARFSPDNTKLATGSPDRQLMLWDVQTGKLLKQWQVAVKPDNPLNGALVYSLAFVDNTHLVSDASSGISEYWRF
ncbi:hypothetical protein N7931_12185 [Catenovulum sp. 2E275]|uniref:WD40 repeat domain-containing protein n=1 Tax=Catenovulum sp. 2E275 TaxID=2980497 RepID=UPI0021D2A2A0|nr:hypothetical protein [Catenovulum sp. 2E275]MCU4676387.1 hypothetical protein [Catenovulum sp. 2E275]